MNTKFKAFVAYELVGAKNIIVTKKNNKTTMRYNIHFYLNE